MEFEIRKLFENRLKCQLEGLYAKPDVDRIMETVTECLRGFDLVRSSEEEYKTDDLLSIFLNAMRIQGRSDKTIRRYTYLLEKMVLGVKTCTNEITVYHLRNYLAQEKARGLADSTLEGLRQVLHAYFGWLHKEGLILQNPTVNLGKIKTKKIVKTIYSDMEIERLKQHCTCSRDRAIIMFLLSTGCRISEMVQLNRDDIDFVSLECTVLGKGDKERIVYIDSVTGMIIKQYLNGRVDDNPALFVGLKEPYERLMPNGVRTTLKKIGKNANVQKVHPHKFRRTMATNFIRHGMPIQEVAAILGHEKIDTTMEYVVMDKTAIKTAYQKYA